jgi:hypothetical protein
MNKSRRSLHWRNADGHNPANQAVNPPQRISHAVDDLSRLQLHKASAAQDLALQFRWLQSKPARLGQDGFRSCPIERPGRLVHVVVAFVPIGTKYIGRGR